MEIVVRASGTFIDFVVSHEINHLISGHFDIVKNHVKKRELTRAMEFCADYNALMSSFFILMRPLIVEGTDHEQLTSIPKTFGFILTIYYSLRSSPECSHSLYPQFYERILMILSRTLVSCRKGKHPVEDAFSLMKSSLMDGVFLGLTSAIEMGLLEKTKNITALFPSGECQRKNCLSCSTFARDVYAASQPLIQATLQHENMFNNYNKNVFGFNAKNFNQEKLYNSRISVCRLDDTYLTRLMRTMYNTIKAPISSLLKKIR
jgi:hypothetical protein